MEIKYSRIYAPKGKRYTVGEIGLAFGFAMEVIEPRPRLSEGKLNLGESCLLLFAISPEEYALRESDPKALDALAERLSKIVPQDRLLACLTRDLKGMPTTNKITLKMGQSIDDGEFQRRLQEKQRLDSAGPIDAQLLECKRLQQLCRAKDAPEGVKADWKCARAALGRALAEVDGLYAAYDAVLGDRWPAVGFDGRVEIFTTKERGEKALRQIQKANGEVKIWSLKALSGADKAAFFKELENDGLYDLRVDNGFAAAELSLADMEFNAMEESAALRSMMLRESAYGMRWNAFKQAGIAERNQIGALESMLSMRNFVWHRLGKSILYALCDTRESADGFCTLKAYEKLPEKDGFRVVGGEKCLSLTNKQTKQQLLAVFTSPVRAAAFCERLGADAKPVAMCFDEVLLRAKPCDGVVIDPESLSYRILKQDFDKLRESWSKPPVMVRIKTADEEQPAQVEEKKPEASAVLTNPDMTELPNPDELPEVPKAQAADAQAETASEAEDAPKQKGFFRRFFGK